MLNEKYVILTIILVVKFKTIGVDMSLYNLSDLEEQIKNCWVILREVKTLDEAILETDITKDKIMQILLGTKELYQIKFDKLSMIFQYVSRDSDFEQLLLECWQIIDDLNLIIDALPNADMDADKISNTLMGIEYLYDLKFNKFWKHYISLIKN